MSCCTVSCQCYLTLYHCYIIFSILFRTVIQIQRVLHTTLTSLTFLYSIKGQTFIAMFFIEKATFYCKTRYIVFQETFSVTLKNKSGPSIKTLFAKRTSNSACFYLFNMKRSQGLIYNQQNCQLCAGNLDVCCFFLGKLSSCFSAATKIRRNCDRCVCCSW